MSDAERLISERVLLEQRLARVGVDLVAHRNRVSERNLCAVRNPATAAEDALQGIRSESARAMRRQLREVEHGLQRLLTEPDRCGRCVRCEQAIAAERLEVLPSTTLCARCAGRANVPRGSLL